MAESTRSLSIDAYIARFPPQTGRVLQELRELIGTTAPEATETISYAMPTFVLDRKNLVHFAGWKNHVGFYPIASGMTPFDQDLAPFRAGKGSLQFPLDRPLPRTLIQRIVEHRVGEIRGGP